MGDKMNDNNDMNVFAYAGMFVTGGKENKRYMFKPSKLKIWLYEKLFGYIWVDYKFNKRK